MTERKKNVKEEVNTALPPNVVWNIYRPINVYNLFNRKMNSRIFERNTVVNIFRPSATDNRVMLKRDRQI